MSRQVSYFIEGGDNVGKSTLIDYVSKNLMTDMCKNHIYKDSIYMEVNKYPSKDNTEFMNVISKVLKVCKDENYSELYSEVNDLLINTMMKDMKSSFNSLIRDNWNYINISDRGPLSTFLYNYNINSMYDETTNLKNFIHKYFLSKYNYLSTYQSCCLEDFIANLNIVILNNNLPNIPIVSDKQEEIEYKKNFDNNTELQQRINCQISNIVTAIDSEKDIDTITYPFKLHYINIYHDNGVRKTTKEVYEEFKKLVFNTIKEIEESK